jgi:hypothetical protein
MALYSANSKSVGAHGEKEEVQLTKVALFLGGAAVHSKFKSAFAAAVEDAGFAQ